MQPRAFALIAAASLVLMAQQDAPLRGPGRFEATVTGALLGKASGDASVTKFKDGRRELHLLLNSQQMMASGVMFAVTIKLPASTGRAALSPELGNALIQWDNLAKHTHHSADAAGAVEFKGKDLLTGKFSLTATAGTEVLTLSGQFENAPAIPGID